VRGSTRTRCATALEKRPALCDRRPEERHHAIALDPIDRSLEAPDGVAHREQARVEPLHRLFGIQVRDPGGGAHDVGEEDRDLLALAIQ